MISLKNPRKSTTTSNNKSTTTKKFSLDKAPYLDSVKVHGRDTVCVRACGISLLCTCVQSGHEWKKDPLDLLPRPDLDRDRLRVTRSLSRRLLRLRVQFWNWTFPKFQMCSACWSLLLLRQTMCQLFRLPLPLLKLLMSQ